MNDYAFSRTAVRPKLFKPRIVLIGTVVVLVTFLILLKNGSANGSFSTTTDSLYTHQKSYLQYAKDSTSYRIAVVADKDKRSKNTEKGQWESLLKRGTLKRNPTTNQYTINWDQQEEELALKINEEGRGMELSELVHFNDKLYTVDDRTGLVMSIENGKVIPQQILMDGNGKSDKGFKCEWATVKDGLLWVGSTGKEWTKNGVVISNNPQWVKTIDVNGKISHIDWTVPFETMRKAAGAQYPGYMIHEAGAWNPVLRKWFFLPRRFSTEEYDDVADEERGTNLVIVASEFFHDVQVHRIGELHPTRGFSSLAIIPGRETEIVAIKSEEFKDRIASYITVFDVISGEVLMSEVEIGTEKFEGVEIL